MNTVLGLLAKGDMNCAGGDITDDLFGGAAAQNGGQTQRTGQTDGLKSRKEEEERRRQEEEERKAREEKEEEERREEEERKKNSTLNKSMKSIKKFFKTIIEPENE